MTAAQLASNVQSGTKVAADSFNRFVEGDEGYTAVGKGSRGVRAGAGPDGEKRDFWESFGAAPKGPARDKQDFWDSFGAAPAGPPAEKRDFWDDFSAAGEARMAQHEGGGAGASVGTAAMRNTGAGKGKAPASGGGKDEEWKEW